jgi:hypothetical protein
MISWSGRWQSAKLRLRMHSQFAGFVIGFLLAAVSAGLWYASIIDEIIGSLLVGVGAAVIAAAIFAYLTPFNEPAFRKFLSLGIEGVWSSRDEIDERYWVDRVHEAAEKCTLLGIAHGKWCEDVRFQPTLHERLNHGVMFKMLFLNPESPAADLRASEEQRQKKRDTRNAIRQSIQKMWLFRQGLEAGLRDRLRLYVYTATPSCGLMWIDKTMLVTHYLPGLPDVTSPALLIRPPQGGIEGSLYNTFASNFEIMENFSIPIDEGNIQQFLPQDPLEQQPHGPAA